MNASRRTPASWPTSLVCPTGRHRLLRRNARYIVESLTGPGSTSSIPTRLSSVSLRCPHASHPAARALASASTASWAGVGHGPFVEVPAASHRYQVGRGIPSRSQNATTVMAAPPLLVELVEPG